jgi:DNA-binding winged helix-turn-helix (wHTH) protein
MESYFLYGPVPLNHPTFVSRHREVQEIATCIEKADHYVAVLGSRQTGKTTLLDELMATYSGTWDFVWYDFQNWGDLDTPTAYLRLSEEATSKLSISPSPNPSEIKTGAEFEDFVAELASITPSSRLVFLVDEPEGLTEETSRQVGSTFRKFFMSRHKMPSYGKVVFVLFSSLDLHRLHERFSSPLKNIVECIYLDERDFSVDAIRKLADVGGLSAHAERIFWWTNGHPYLSQRLCSILEENPALSVDKAVDELIDGGDANIDHIVGHSEKYLQILKRIWQGEKIKFSRGTPQLRELELIGLIQKDSDAYCIPRSQIYHKALQHQMPPPPPPPQETQEIFVDEQSGDVWVRGTLLDPHLTKDEYNLLAYLYRRCGEICTRYDIVIAVWGEKYIDEVDDARIDKLVERVRKRIEPNQNEPRYILTVRGRGYKLVHCSTEKSEPLSAKPEEIAPMREQAAAKILLEFETHRERLRANLRALKEFEDSLPIKHRVSIQFQKLESRREATLDKIKRVEALYQDITAKLQDASTKPEIDDIYWRWQDEIADQA